MTGNSIVQMTEPSTAKNADRIRVFLRDCKAELRVGINPSELNAPQTVIVNVEVEAALPHRYQDLTETKLDRVINYEPIYNYIRDELPKLGHIPLLETVAEQIVGFCFQDVRVQAVRVRLEKPNVFGQASAGIEVYRTR
ncbi:MAG TPA: dihydroneopterin aldolase [Alphaproteobacteria bacterium]|nr:dihydroneopterin aldolase [Alphaproteobacteria bacterium]